MIIKKQLLSLVTMAVSLLTMMSSCSMFSHDDNDPYSYIQAVAYQLEEDGKYGMMDLNGVSIIEPRFDKEPTEASCDRFFVQDADGLWELYTLEANPRRVGTTKYKDVGAFVEGFCPVTEPGSTPIYINVEGEQLISTDRYLDENDNFKRIIAVGNFQEGKAIIKGENELLGLINDEGRVIVTPQYELICNYRHGVTIALKPKNPGEDDDKQVWVILDREGHVNFSSTMGDMEPLQDWFDDNDRLLVECKDESYAFVNIYGEKVQTLESDAISDIKVAYDGLMSFRNGKYKCGLINADGKIVIKPKYDNFKWLGGHLIVAKIDKDDDEESDEEEFTILNTDGEELNTIKTSQIWMPSYKYQGYANRFICYKDSTNEKTYCYIYGEDGKQLPSSMIFYSAAGHSMTTVLTDYALEDLLITHMKFTKEGFYGFKYNDFYKDMDLDMDKFDKDDEMRNVGILDDTFLSQEFTILLGFNKDLTDSETYDERRLQSLHAGLYTKDHAKLYDKVRAEIEKIATFSRKGSLNNHNGDIFDIGNGFYYFLANNSQDDYVYVAFGK